MNARPWLPLLACLAAPSTYAATLAIAPSSISIAPGASSTVQLRITGDALTVGVEGEVLFNPAQLGITATAGSGSQCRVDAAAGRVTAMRVQLTHAPFPASDGVVCTLTVSVLPAVPADSALMLDVANAKFADGLAQAAAGIHSLSDGIVVARPPAVVEDVVSAVPHANEDSFAPVTDVSGRYVIFQSAASNLHPDDTSEDIDVFRIDLETGAIELVSVDNVATKAVGGGAAPSVNANGTAIVFEASNAGMAKLLGETKSQAKRRRKQGGIGVYLRNLVTGTTQQIASNASHPRIAPAGRAVVYVAPHPTVPAQTEIFRVGLTRSGGEYVKDPAPTCVSCKAVTAGGSATNEDSNGSAKAPVISADGRTIAWESAATNPIAGAAPPCPGASSVVLLRNLVTGALQRASAPAAGGACGSAGNGAVAPSIDWSGTRVAFVTPQPLKPGDSNATHDAYVFDAAGAKLIRASESPGGTQANGATFGVTLSGDGSTIAFTSEAQNLDAEADTNGHADVHVGSLTGGRVANLRRLGRTRQGNQANAPSQRAALNYNGTRVTYDSDASNLTGSSNGFLNLYQRPNPIDPFTILRAGFD